MAISDLWKKREQGPAFAEMHLSEVLRDYDIQYVNDTPGQEYAVITSKVDKRRAGLSVGEFGSSAPSPWTSFTRDEYNPKMRGMNGLETYDKMRRNDGAVRSTLRAAKIPVLGARWFVDPGGDKDIDAKAAKWVEKNLFTLMSTPWFQTLTEALLMLDFGYYMFEKVWETKVVDGELRTVLKKLGPRHPMDVKKWSFDANGGPSSVTFYPPTMSSYSQQDVTIPIEKMLVFSFDKESGNIEGISLLRSAWKHWYYKEQLYKIDAIQKERHGIGIPMIKLPLGYTQDDKKAADELGRNVRTNERAHIVLPPGWDLTMLKLEGNPVDCLKSIEHHDDMIRQNILASFLSDSNANDDSQTMFLKATRFVADIVAETINTYLVPQMTMYNFANAAVPRVRVRRIGEQNDQRTVSFAVRNLVGAGVIVPDEPLEAEMREMMDLPMADPETARPQVTPQQPDPNEPEEQEQQSKAKGARVGPPRQSQAANQKSLPSSGAGRDGSGK